MDSGLSPFHILHFGPGLVTDITTNRTAATPVESASTSSNMASSGIIQISNETEIRSSRITTGGRKITYHMRVIQQPERARACGSGAKCEFAITTVVYALPLTLYSVCRPSPSRSSSNC